MKTKIKSVSILIILSFALNNQQCYGQTENQEISKVKAHISELLKSKVVFAQGPIIDNMWSFGASEKDITTFDDRIELKNKNQLKVINYADLIDMKITYRDKGSLPIVEIGDFLVEFKDPVNNNSSLFYKDLMAIKLKLYDNAIIAFEQIAAKYHALEVKPTISEEQRKYIVQANGFTEMKEYNKATEIYKKAIKVNPTSYPAAYSNLALLAAQINDYSIAIFYMKKYLMLVPEAQDARSAQDKIYLWEAQLDYK